jgi:hypothetical protein
MEIIGEIQVLVAKNSFFVLLLLSTKLQIPHKYFRDLFNFSFFTKFAHLPSANNFIVSLKVFLSKSVIE